MVTVRPDGTDERQLTHVPEGKQAGAPDISPDGRTIAYVSNEGGDNFAVWAMNVDGSGQHQLFGKAGFDFFQPRWSPDGTKLVVTRCDSSVGFITNCDIVLAKRDGSGAAHPGRRRPVQRQRHVLPGRQVDRLRQRPGRVHLHRVGAPASTVAAPIRLTEPEPRGLLAELVTRRQPPGDQQQLLPCRSARCSPCAGTGRSCAS